MYNDSLTVDHQTLRERLRAAGAAQAERDGRGAAFRSCAVAAIKDSAAPRSENIVQQSRCAPVRSRAQCVYPSTASLEIDGITEEASLLFGRAKAITTRNLGPTDNEMDCNTSARCLIL